jgi:hypothetical protein
VKTKLTKKKQMKIKEEIIKEDINRNLKNVDGGKPLDISLSVLNGEFKEEYRKKYGEFEKQDKEEVKKKMREYYQKPEIKKKMREYYQKPEIKKKKREYMREYQRKKFNIPKSRWRENEHPN